MVRLSARSELPLRLLSKTVNSVVLVKLKDGTEFIGRLEFCDPSMNIVLVEAKEVDEESKPIVNLGRIFIRGSNILFVSVDASRVKVEE